MNELDSVRGKGKSLCSFFSLLFQTSSVILLQPWMKSEAEILFFLVMFVCLKAQCHLILKCHGLTGFSFTLFPIHPCSLHPQAWTKLTSPEWERAWWICVKGGRVGWGRGFFPDPLTFTLSACPLWLFYGLINGGGGFQDKGRALRLVQLTLWVLTMEGLNSPVCFHRKLFQIDDQVYHHLPLQPPHLSLRL